MSADATFASPVLAPAPAFASYNDRRYAAGYGSRSYVTGRKLLLDLNLSPGVNDALCALGGSV